MFNSRNKVDKHVASILQGHKSDTERKKVGYQIASLYAKIKEYQVASRYLEGFLQVNPDFAAAHALRGEIFENLNQPVKAIEAYKRSLEINEDQRNLLVKVCQLYCQVDVDPDRARYWAEKLERVYPKHEVVFRLREKICATSDTGENSKELEDLYTAELRKRPHDVNAHIKLLRLYIDQDRINEAYTQAVKTEQAGSHDGSLEWYRCLLDIYQEYERDSKGKGGKVNGAFHTELLWAECRLVAISIEQAKVVDAVEALQSFDQTLKNVQSISCPTPQWDVFRKEMQAQLYHHAAVLLLKKAKDGWHDWRETSSLAGPCFLLSYSVSPPHMKASWYVQAGDQEKDVYDRWYDSACLRASQSGHMIRILASSRGKEWISQIQEDLCNEQGKDRLFEMLFNQAHIHASQDKSFLYNNANFMTFNPRMPDDQDLKELDLAVHKMHPGSLHHVVWQALQYYSTRDMTQPNYNLNIFEKLPYGTLKLDTASAVSLCQLDVEAFLYATVFDVAHSLQGALPEPGVPSMLPVAISDQLATPEQSKWWTAVYQLVHNINKDRQSESQRTLQMGLEKIRLVGPHGIDASTLMHLARTFAERLQESKSQQHSESIADLVEQQNTIQARIEHYWSGAIQVLDKIISKKNITPPKFRLFTNRDLDLDEEEVGKLLEEARFNLALVSMETGDYQMAISEFAKVSWPEASFEQGQCYKKLSDSIAHRSFESMDCEEQNQQIALLSKAQECFKIVIDRLVLEPRRELYGKALEEYEEIAVMLDKFDNFDIQSVCSEVTTTASNINGTPPYPSAVRRLPGTPMRTPVRPSSRTPLRAAASSTPRARGLARDSLPLSVPGSRENISILDSSCAQRTPRKAYPPSPERLEVQLQSMARSRHELVEELRRTNRVAQKLQDRVESLERLSHQNESLSREHQDIKSQQSQQERSLMELKLQQTNQDQINKDLRAQQTRLEYTVKQLELMISKNQVLMTNQQEQIKRAIETQRATDEINKALQDQIETLKSQQQHPVMSPAHGMAAMMSPHGPHVLPSHMQPQGQMPGINPLYDMRLPRPPMQQAMAPGSGYGAALGGLYNYTHAGLGPQQQFQPMGQMNTPYNVLPQGLTSGMPRTPQIGDYPHQEDDDDEVNGYYHDDDEDDDEGDGQNTVDAALHEVPLGRTQMPDAQLMHQWPYGNNVQIEGRSQSTVAYSPTHQVRQPAAGFMNMSPGHVYPGMFPPSPGRPPMPGPGFFAQGKPIDQSASKLPQPLIIQPVPSQATSTPQGVSVTAVSGPDLFKLPPTTAVATSYPMTMPANAASGVNRAQAPLHFSTQVNQPVTPTNLSPNKPKTPTKSGDEPDSEAEGNADDSYTGPDFKPLVHLELVETTSGEEGEEVLFNNRAKLFRFIEMQWKERGIGSMKILHNKEAGTVRVLMRRDQILKVCANHLIKYDMEIDFKVKEDSKDEMKTLTWKAFDHTDPEPRLEQFCCRFKTPDIAAQFKEAFEKAKEIATVNKSPEKTKPPVTKEPASSTPATKESIAKPPEKPVKSTSGDSALKPVNPPKFQGFGTPKDSKECPASPKPTQTFGVESSIKSTFPVFGSSSSAKVSSASDMLKAFASKSAENPDEKSTEKPKTAFGGFTFSAAPVVKTSETKEAQKIETKVAPKEPEKNETASPFANFSFGRSSSTPSFGGTPTFGSLKPTTKAADSTKPQTTLFGSMGGGNFPAFGTLATEGAKASVFGEKKADSPFSVGKPVFQIGKASPDKGASGEGDDEEKVEEYEPDVDFKPIVTLPENVDLKTGEENEEKLFGERAKLYRNDPDTKQWKERGTGELKILKNTENGNFRILMRREQVLKTCANHMISKDMKLLPMQASDKAWCWFANDFAEEEMKAEQFAAKFKSKDEALQFKEAFEECVKELISPTTNAVAKEVKSDQKKGTESLADQFKAKSGEWECETCYVRNTAAARKCLACETPNPNAPAEEPSKTGSLADQFKAKSGEWDCEACYVRNKAGTKKCLACETLKPGETADAVSSSTDSAFKVNAGAGGGFTFGGSTFGNSAKSSEATSKQTTGGFTFGGNASFGSFAFGKSSDPVSSTTEAKPATGGGFKFPGAAGFGSTTFGSKPSGTLEEKVTQQPDSTSDATPSGFHFGDKTGFSFSGVTPMKSDRPKTPKTPTSPEDGFYVNQEGEDDHIYFTPIVKLPDTVVVSTGEEDEDLVFVHRAKLYRFSQDEWKERGIGNIKILRNKTALKARILMRREQVLKLCMNHMITSDMELKPMQNAKGKAWVWHAIDFAEDDQSHEQFAIRFGSEEMANDFKEAFDKARDDPKSLPIVEDKPCEKPEKSKDKSSKTPKKDQSEKQITLPEVSSSTLSTFSFKSPEISKSIPDSSSTSGFTFQSSSAKFSFSGMSPGSTPTKSIFGAAASSVPAPTTAGRSLFGKSGEMSTPVFGSGASTIFGGTPSLFGGNSSGTTDEAKLKPGGGILAKLLAEPAKDSVPTGEEPLDLSAVVSSTDGDIIVICDEEIPDTLVQEARKYQLPDAFYLYKQRPACKGCLGCLTDEFDFSKIGSHKAINLPTTTRGKKATQKPVAEETKTVVKPVADTTKTVVEADSTSATPTSGPLFSGGSGIDFAAIAAKGSGDFAFGKTSDASKPFAFAGAGAAVFGKSPTKGKPQTGGDDDDDDDDDVEESPDVHFEPIVQLPEVVDLRTGEEEDIKIFSSRSKLYRYDSDESAWKERGIGEMKILKNKITGRYRMLMRREQVLKVACNHALTTEMVLQPLHTSETAWCWYALDYADNEPREEQFAVRFKNKELAAEFKIKFDECQSDLKNRSDSPSNGEAGASSQGESQESHSSARESLTGEEEEDYEDEEELMDPMFSKRATLYYVIDKEMAVQTGMGDLQVIYDEDVFGARIRMTTDADKMICNHIVCRRYTVITNEKKKTCEWTAKDFSTDEPVKRTFRAQFSSANAVQEFQRVFQQGLEWAQESEIDEVTDGASVTGELTEPQIAGQR